MTSPPPPQSKTTLPDPSKPLAKLNNIPTPFDITGLIFIDTMQEYRNSLPISEKTSCIPYLQVFEREVLVRLYNLSNSYKKALAYNIISKKLSNDIKTLQQNVSSFSGLVESHSLQIQKIHNQNQFLNMFQDEMQSLILDLEFMDRAWQKSTEISKPNAVLSHSSEIAYASLCLKDQNLLISESKKRLTSLEKP